MAQKEFVLMAEKTYMDNANILVKIILFGVAFIMISTPKTRSLHSCTTIKQDVKNLEVALEKENAKGKIWLWRDEGYSITFAITTLLKNDVAILSFYDGTDCLMPHPRTGAIRTQLPLTDKIKAYIKKSKLYWENTE